MGLVTVTASHSAFIGAIPEEDLDLSWTPAVSAANWRRSFGELSDRDQGLLVAESTGRIVGFVWWTPWADSEGYDAAVRSLYVLPTCQRRGIGRQLLEQTALDLARRRLRSLEVGCIRENPSCAFYRRLGASEIGRRPSRIDRFETEEILFGWPDASVLA